MKVIRISRRMLGVATSILMGAGLLVAVAPAPAHSYVIVCQRLEQWYSVSGPAGRLQDASLDRATLIPYLASRHRQGERLTLRSFQWKGYGLGYGQFLYSLTRSARDLQVMSYFGKGAVLCLHPQTISVWSMGPQ